MGNPVDVMLFCLLHFSCLLYLLYMLEWMYMTFIHLRLRFTTVGSMDQPFFRQLANHIESLTNIWSSVREFSANKDSSHFSHHKRVSHSLLPRKAVKSIRTQPPEYLVYSVNNGMVRCFLSYLSYIGLHDVNSRARAYTCA
ncbi:unnamed protein product [Albugo candida]|uniref:Uncharacterized protein n=1 Tax=Albugo candida TaxID=65357 RepID=A0A024FWJ8_9STRA|nr:unnamed protein product [Albugo candida]|eukprot:CCI11312.1 unnamed protein product [Albugo candida]